MQLITNELVALDADLGSTKDEVIASLARIVEAAGRADAAGLTADALDREGKAATGLPGGFAIPHCRSAAVSQASLAFARLSNPVDFGAKDGPADLVFLIAAAADGDADHLKLLTKLARALVKKDFLASLRSAGSREEVVALVDAVVNPPAKPAADASAPAATATVATAAAAPAASESATRPVLVAVTACPTGIAHTYMAADSLVAAGEELGYDVQVETQGSGGVTPLPADTIRNAVAAIFATDVGVKEPERFAGLPVIESGVKRAINEPKKMVEEAVAASTNPNAHRVSGTASTASPDAAGGSQLGWGKRIQQALMTGVSYMLPFVAAGGLLIALGFLFAGYDVALAPDCANLPAWAGGADAATCAAAGSYGQLAYAMGPGVGLLTWLGSIMFLIGGAAFGFLVPALSGYIAYSLAGRPGIAPGFVGGAISVALGAGFLGGLVTGIVAGLLALWLTTFSVPRWLAGLMPVAIIPLVVTFLTGALMYMLLGKPLAALTTALYDGLGGMTGGSVVLLGVVLGLMMCFDLGGPVNKAAYLFATAGLSAQTEASFMVMAAVMAAGMVPPLAMALATTLRKKLFSKGEVENGRTAWLLGAAFISEGAIPFAAADPLRVIPSMMLGGAVTGALSMALGVGSRAPHGGIFVAFAIQNLLGFIIAIVAGMIVGAVAVIAAKQFLGNKAAVNA
ncbi:PTS sugar transporter subunit IIA [Propioniciclava sp. MC1595]|uniref:PTS fructose transporter subunit IIABC n=1 Tax=Propioniciclava sp. MC1595 TaxID=2760308 RepID=UPI0016622CAC|nr:fructose-specific PTS transporter subunit EIIC [Propioniciclava sp. MC1595]MBB1494706.1 PTS sugar transporter subunit IIA [Propioniciclava sp. MC1595]QTE25781.1 PTS sugar transporter subunit IIA [Propioniciclava sp. MC1595]